jgi:putative glycosyltransferase (TIGR04372 family)
VVFEGIAMKTLTRHFLEIRSGGLPVLRFKIVAILKNLFIVLSGIWAVPVVLVVRCISPWRLIRFGSITCSRIGPFVTEAGLKWALHQMQEKKTLDLYWFDKQISNEFWAAMVRRNFHIHPWVCPLDFWSQVIPGGSRHAIPAEMTTSSNDMHGWIEKTKAHMDFLPDEDAKARAWLRKQGWKDNEPFVCLLVRDSSYMDSFGQNTDMSPGCNARYDPKYGYGWRHLDYRDSDIATYVPAAEWLADQGIWVLRMGKIMAKSIPCTHPRIIDYAFHPEKCDFLDIWLFAHCDLCISTGTGPDMISAIYRRPILYVNYSLLFRLLSWSNSMTVPKNMAWLSSGVFLNLREHLNFNTNYPERVGIRMIDLTPEEILAAVQERWQRVKGTWVDTDDDLMRQYQFWEIFRAHPDFHRFHDFIHPEARCGALWLRSMGDAFFE